MKRRTYGKLGLVGLCLLGLAAVSQADLTDAPCSETSSTAPCLFENIPNWGKHTTFKKAVTAGGNWNTPGTWVGNAVPTATDNVEIPAGTTVTMDVGPLSGTAATPKASTKILVVNGTLIFSTAQSTNLEAHTILVGYSGILRMATRTTSLAVTRQASITLGGNPLGTGPEPYDPNQATPYDNRKFAGGLLILGRFEAGGALRKTFVRQVGNEGPATAGGTADTALSVSGIGTGWRAGDNLVALDSRTPYLKYGPVGNPANFSESLQITGTPVESTQTMVNLVNTLAQPAMKNPHYGNTYAAVHAGFPAPSVNGTGFFPHVINLTKNIVLRSKTPGTVADRGHVYVGGSAKIDIDNVAFKDLGRTQVGAFTKYGDANNFNPKGRYSLHFHHNNGEFTTGDPLVDYRSRVTNCAFSGGLKWHVALHASTRIQLSGNAFYKASGAGLMTEDGDEGWNVIDNNIAASIKNTSTEAFSGTNRWTTERANSKATSPIDFNRDHSAVLGSEGVGFWLSSAADMAWRNVAVDCDLNGFRIYMHEPSPYLDGGGVSTMEWNGNNLHPRPRFPEQAEASFVTYQFPFWDHRCWDLSPSSISAFYPTGDYREPRSMPLGDNEAYGCLKGMEIWDSDISVRNSVVWNSHVGLEPWRSPDMLIDGVTVRGDGTNTASWAGNYETIGVSNTFHPVVAVVSRADVAGVNIGVKMDTGRGTALHNEGPGPYTGLKPHDGQVLDSWFQCPVGILVQADLHYKKEDAINGGQFQPGYAGYSGNPGGTTFLRRNKFMLPTGATSYTAVRPYLPSMPFGNDIQVNASDQIYIEDHQGVATEDYRVYYTIQHPSFQVPVTYTGDAPGMPYFDGFSHFRVFSAFPAPSSWPSASPWTGTGVLQSTLLGGNEWKAWGGAVAPTTGLVTNRPEIEGYTISAATPGMRLWETLWGWYDSTGMASISIQNDGSGHTYLSGPVCDWGAPNRKIPVNVRIKDFQGVWQDFGTTSATEHSVTFNGRNCYYRYWFPVFTFADLTPLRGTTREVQLRHAPWNNQEPYPNNYRTIWQGMVTINP
jgi:hypothetical protein